MDAITTSSALPDSVILNVSDGVLFSGTSCEYAGTISSENYLETEHIVFLVSEGSYYCYFTHTGHLSTLTPVAGSGESFLRDCVDFIER